VAAATRSDGWWDLADDALLAGLGAGDPGATAAFVRRFQPRVLGLAATVLADRTAAEDVAQEALLRAWRHAGTYDARRGSVATWLLTITRNLAIDAIRVGRSTPTDPEVLVQVIGAAAAAGPDDLATTADDVAHLRTALQALPEPQRRALVLARFGGLTAAEVAEREGIPLGTAKTRIRDGFQRLRTELAEADL
jgi:RNA polymerase sigma factor (sigma-70 family)